MSKQKLENRYQVSIDLLNDAVGREAAASLQYIYFHVHFEDERYLYLAKLMRKIAIAEMQHIEEFAERILFLEGDVDMNPSFEARQITDPKEMLEFAIKLEESTILNYNMASQRAAESNDAVTQRMFQDTIAEEEGHLDMFRAELKSLEEYGDNYLALQAVAGSKESVKSRD